MTDRRLFSTLAALAVVFIIAMPSLGSIVLRMDLEDLVSNSDTIIQGVVEAVYSQWDSERNLIFTYAAIGVEDPLKGERRRSLLIRQMGGQVGSLNMTVPGMPEFVAGSSVIVFLKDSGNGTFQVVGMNQGRYLIAEDFAVSALTGIDLMDPKTGLVSGTSAVRKVGLEDFKREIRELVR